jgi:DNA-binding Lrp family transcriptional regulator
MKLKIDPTDAKLLFLLGRNARLSHTALAKALRTSREVVAFRIKRLMKQGILLGTVLNVDLHRIGRGYFQVLVRLGGISEKRANEFEHFLAHTQRVTYVSEVAGNWNYLIAARAHSLRELNDLLDQLTTKFPEIAELRQYLVLDEHGPGWGVVLTSSRPAVPADATAFTQAFSHRKPVEHAALDAADERILDSLGNDARKGILDVAREAKVSYRTAFARITRMIKDGIIDHFGCIAALSKLGFAKHTLFLRIADIARNEGKVREFFASLHSCSRYWRLMGPTHFRVNLYTNSTEELEQILRKIRTALGDALLDMECLGVLSQKKGIGHPVALRTE